MVCLLLRSARLHRISDDAPHRAERVRDLRHVALSEALLKQPERWPIQDIPWGSDAVLDSTIRQAQTAGVNPALIASRQDLDRFSDLTPWLS